MIKFLANLSVRTTLSCLFFMMGLIATGLSGSEVVSAYWKRAAAMETLDYSAINQALFKALVSTRRESPPLRVAVIEAPDKNQNSVSAYMAARQDVDAAIASAQDMLQKYNAVELSSTTRALNESYIEYGKLRTSVDGEAKLQLAARDKTLPARVQTVSNTFIQALDASLGAVESEIRKLKPGFADLIIISSLAGQTRAAAGASGQTINAVLAQNRPFDAQESITVQMSEANSKFGWTAIQGIARSAETEPQIKTAIAKAEALFFSTTFKGMKEKLIVTLSSNQTAAITTQMWRDLVIPANESIGDLARVAIDALHARAEDALASASKTLAAFSALLFGAFVLTGVSYALIRSRVIHPLTGMTEMMKTMAKGDLSVEIPRSTRKDEMGAMADALTVFKENAVRVRALEDAERSASADRLARAKNMEAVVTDVGDAVSAAANGDFSARLRIENADATMQKLVEGINEINEVVDGATTEFADRLYAIADGDLTQNVQTVYRGRFKDLKDAINKTMDRLSSTVRTIQTTSADVANAAREINNGASDLSKRTDEQASSLEQTAATTEELAASVKASAQAAKAAAVMAGEALTAAETGGLIANDAVEAMTRIESASQRISDIIRVIDDIAFQTNLLALNAAVEAARAGDAGKGFAVVASEVRTLAQRSSSAAKDIAGLILSSNVEVGAGVRLVRQAGDQLSQIMAASQKVASTIAEISAASGEQANGIDEMSQAVAHLDEMTQHNAALSEQSAASAGALREKIDQLNELVAAFKTGHEQQVVHVPDYAALKEIRTVHAPAFLHAVRR